MTSRAPFETSPVVGPETAVAYDRFLRDAALGWDDFDPYYSQEIARFQLRDDDVLLASGDTSVEPSGCGVTLSSDRARARLEVCGVRVREATAIIGAIDGVRTTRDVRARAAVSADAWTVTVARAFGVLLFAPVAMAELEAQVSGVEIVRFPGSPYEVVRPYWENMVSVRKRLEASTSAFADTAAFVGFLRELHALSLVGKSEGSFYRPASPIAAKGRSLPGELLLESSVTEVLPTHVRFVSGPRVNATLIGGDFYHSLLGAALGDPGASEPSRDIVLGDLPWGRVVVARADTDDAEAPWFCPPRPLDSRHFDFMRASFVEAVAAAGRRDRDAALSSLAGLHWAFVRLHPFRFANQCVAMCLVNHVLTRVCGTGMPHLVLDHLALRFTQKAYERAFRNAVEAWCVKDESSVRRWVELASRKRRAFALLEDIRAAATLDDARILVRSRADDARFVLLGSP